MKNKFVGVSPPPPPPGPPLSVFFRAGGASSRNFATPDQTPRPGVALHMIIHTQSIYLSVYMSPNFYFKILNSTQYCIVKNYINIWKIVNLRWISLHIRIDFNEFHFIIYWSRFVCSRWRDKSRYQEDLKKGFYFCNTFFRSSMDSPSSDLYLDIYVIETVRFLWRRIILLNYWGI